MHAKTLAYQLELSNKLLEMNTGDVSHEESLLTPPKGGSCLNQVVGHLTRTRNMALGSMGQKSPYPMKEFDPYDDRTGVPFSRENALPFDELRRRFKAMQEPLISAIKGMPPEVWPPPLHANSPAIPTRPSAATLRLLYSTSATTWGKPGCCGESRASRVW